MKSNRVWGKACYKRKLTEINLFLPQKESDRENLINLNVHGRLSSQEQ